MVPKKSFRRQMIRWISLLGAFLSLFFTAEILSQPGAILFTKSHANKRAESPAGNRIQDSASAKSALMRLPISFEPAPKADQFLVQEGRYRMLLTAAQTTIAATARNQPRLLTMTLLGANRSAHAEPFEPLPGKRNYLIGADRASWRTDHPPRALQ